MMIKKKIGMILIVLILLGAASLLFLKKLNPPDKTERLRIGIFPDTICALIYIAQQQGMFKRYGLDVSLENYQAGAYAVNDLLGGKIDLGTASEFVLAIQSFKRPNLRTVGTISSLENIELIARKDRKIEKPEDLRGKTIGVSKGTAAEFFLSTFLSLNNVLPTEVRVVDLKPPELVMALSGGKIDAASSFSPFTDEMKKNLAHNAIAWPIQSGQDYYFLLITTEQLIQSRPRVISSLLKGALEAEVFLKKNEKEARSIVESALKLDHEGIMSTWSKTRFHVRLDQDLLTLMEDEARWAIANRYVDAAKIPNYFHSLSLEGLKKLKSEAVSVIH